MQREFEHTLTKFHFRQLTAAFPPQNQDQIPTHDQKCTIKPTSSVAKSTVSPSSSPPESCFGYAPRVQSTGSRSKPTARLTPLSSLTPALSGEHVVLRGRVHTIRAKGRLAFLLLRSFTEIVQVIFVGGEHISKPFLRFVSKLHPESIVEVTGTVSVAPVPIANTTQPSVEISGRSVFVISEAPAVLPFQLADASGSEKMEKTAGTTESRGPTDNKEENKVSLSVNPETRLDHRWLDLRTPANHAIFVVESKMQQYFREYLTNPERSFTEIHTPKLIGTASEGGASVFRLDYFGRKVFLAQSPQLYKQMALQGDLGKGVFEIGSVFRAENANTYRHLCEFVGLDVEMVIQDHYSECLDLAEDLFHTMFARLENECEALLRTVRAQFPVSPIAYAVPESVIHSLGVGILEDGVESTDLYGATVRSVAMPSLRLSYPNAITLLNEVIIRVESAKSSTESESKSFLESLKGVSDASHDFVIPPPMEVTEDLSTTHEKFLGRVIKQRYGVDFYVIDKYPRSVRPFYTMPAVALTEEDTDRSCEPNLSHAPITESLQVQHPPCSRLWSNSYDMFLRGEEISSGAQRIHDPSLLTASAAGRGIDPNTIGDYIQSFALGAWPHAGFGVGLERLVMLFLGLRNIRQTSMFPRDPRRVAP